MTHRIFIYGPFALFVMLALGVSVRWWVEADAFSKQLEAMNGRAIAPGVTLHYAGKRISGFPFRLDATFKNLAVEVDTPHGPSRWQSEDFALHRLTYGAARTLFEAAGRQLLSWTDEEGRHHALPFAPGSMRASASDDDGGLARFDLEVVGLGSPALTADQAQFHIRRDPATDALDVFISADGVVLAPMLRSGLGNRIGMLEIAATLLPGASAARFRAGNSDWTEAVRTFERANGSLHVDQVEIAFADFKADAKGMMGLDSLSRPRGLLDFRIAHFGRFLATAGAHGLDRNGKGLASALMARAADGGSDDMGRLDTVFTCSDGIAYLGDRPIGTLGTIF